MRDSSTIAAIATAAGTGGVGIVRVSGSKAEAIALAITHSKKLTYHKAQLTSFFNQDNQLLDKGLVLFFKAPKSFTGENIVEFHAHGGPALLQCLLDATISNGATLAEPGEFTKRAFLNNKIDLTQAEAVADIISASTAHAVVNAANSLSGKFSFKINILLEKLVEIRMYIEACLDFPEEDIDFIEKGQILEKLSQVQTEINDILVVAKKGQIIQEGFQVCLIGKPNVGKSTLLNLFSQEDLAIVTNIPGTTRDPVRALININGIPIKVVDTAGIHETNDPVEKAGIDKSISIINTSSLALVIIDDLNDIDKYINYFLKLNQNVKLIWVFNKIDLIDKSPCVDLIGKHRVISISAKFNEGIGLLEKEILDVFGVQSMDSNESLYASRKRHILALNDIDRYLKSALNNLNQPELLAQDLLSAQNKLSSITGDFSPDDLLGEIFSRFCIGK